MKDRRDHWPPQTHADQTTSHYMPTLPAPDVAEGTWVRNTIIIAVQGGIGQVALQECLTRRTEQNARVSPLTSLPTYCMVWHETIPTTQHLSCSSWKEATAGRAVHLRTASPRTSTDAQKSRPFATRGVSACRPKHDLLQHSRGTVQ